MGRNVESVETEVPVYRVEDDVQLRVRRRFPYDKIISLLTEGEEVFLPIDRKSASYLRKQLENKLGELVEAYPAVYRGMQGYMFRFSLVRSFLDRIVCPRCGHEWSIYEGGSEEED